MAEVIDAALATAGTPCVLGTDPSKFLEKFEDWYEHTSILADAVGVKREDQKLKLMILWGGKDFRKTVKDANVITTGETKDSLDQALVKIRDKFGKHVNLTMGMYKLMHIKHGSKSLTMFRHEVEELAVQCQFEQHPYNKERAIRDAIIFGTTDEKLRKEALAKDVDLETLTKAALGYEQARKSFGTISKNEDVKKVKTYTQKEVDNIVAKVTANLAFVAKIRKQKTKPSVRTAHHITDHMKHRVVQLKVSNVQHAKSQTTSLNQVHANTQW